MGKIHEQLKKRRKELELKQEVMLIPQEKLRAVRSILQGNSQEDWGSKQQKSLSDDPWEGLLVD